jgi:hypothetical protein
MEIYICDEIMARIALRCNTSAWATCQMRIRTAGGRANGVCRFTPCAKQVTWLKRA